MQEFRLPILSIITPLVREPIRPVSDALCKRDVNAVEGELRFLCGLLYAPKATRRRCVVRPAFGVISTKLI